MYKAIKIVVQVDTRHAGSECNKGNCVDTIFEVDEAAKMASDISDERRDTGNGTDRANKSEVASRKAWE